MVKFLNYLQDATEKIRWREKWAIENNWTLSKAT